jgi:hypothetical protein
LIAGSKMKAIATLTCGLGLLAALALAGSGCASRPVPADHNLTIIVDREFARRKASYAWYPAGDDSLFHGLGSGGRGSSSSWSGNLDLGGKDAAVAVAVILAVVVLAVATDATVHNLSGTEVTLILESGGDSFAMPLDWGINRFRVPDRLLAATEQGRAGIAIQARGTRRFRISLPAGAIKSPHAVHTFEFTGSGDIIIDGDRVTSPPALPPDRH